jgi:hypothetical protein
MMTSLFDPISCIDSRHGTPSPGSPEMSISLALTSEQGYGYFPAIPGQFLKDGRYKVSRMLAIGQSSSVFMVRELVEDEWVPVS